MKKLLSLAALCCALLPLYALDNGFLTVGRGTPQIDGKLDDAAWKNAIAAGPFLLQKQTRQAKEQTVVRFLWDDDNLYVAFHCVEKMLRPSDNRLSAFQRNYRTHDQSDDIYADDMVELLLFNPATPKQVYDISLSASGVCNDSANTFNGIDLWSNRDRSWESGLTSGVSVSATEERYFWQAEVAIPWKNLGGKPQNGAKWKVMTARFEQPSKEVSAFQYIPSGGIHEFDKFSVLKFGTKAPGIGLSALPPFVPGKNTLEFQNSGSISTAITSTVQFGDKKTQSASFIGKKNALGKHEVTIGENGDFTFCWQVSGSSDLCDYFRSPAYPCKVSASGLFAELTDSQLTVNGFPAEKKVTLTGGCNVLKLKKLSDRATVRLSAADSLIAFPEGWKLDEKSGEYTLNLYVGVSEIWPNWNTQGVSACRGGLQQLLLHPQGIPGMTLDDYTFYLDLPQGVTLAGASGYYKIYTLEVRNAGRTEHKGKPFTRYGIRVKKSVPYRKQCPSHEYIAAVLEIANSIAENETEFYYHVGSAANAVAELPNRVPLHVLPPADGKQPPLPLRIQLWAGWLPTMDDVALRRKFSACLANAGFTETASAAGLTDQGNGLRGFVNLNFESWNFNCSDFIAQNPDCARVENSGQRSASIPCSTALLHDLRFAGFFRKNLKPWFEKWHRPIHVTWDYEHSVFTSWLGCFCPRCLHDFAEKEKISENPLTWEIIKTKYPEQWTHYMDQRMADVAGFFSRMIHEEFPGTAFSVYSGYQTEKSRQVYGLDWAMLAGKIDLGMIGYGRVENEVADTRNALGKTPMLLGAILYPYDFTARYLPNYAGSARLLRRACDAQAGFLIYSFETVDGRTVSAVAEVSRYMAHYPQFFTSGIRETEKLRIRGWDRADYEVLGDGNGNNLIAIMNSSAETRSFQAEFPLPAGKKLLNAKTGAEVTLPLAGNLKREEVAVFVTK